MSSMDNAYALVIGIADYRNTNRFLSKLPPTVCKDARDIAGLLAVPEQCGYRPENVQLLLDGAATQAALRGALADLAVRCDADSVVFLYVSSHGGYIEAGPEGAYRLLPVKFGAVDESRLPVRLTMLTALNLAHPARAGREFGRLVAVLPGLPPRR
jgi:hypothetical protein